MKRLNGILKPCIGWCNAMYKCIYTQNSSEMPVYTSSIDFGKNFENEKLVHIHYPKSMPIIYIKKFDEQILREQLTTNNFWSTFTIKQVWCCRYMGVGEATVVVHFWLLSWFNVMDGGGGDRAGGGGGNGDYGVGGDVANPMQTDGNKSRNGNIQRTN